MKPEDLDRILDRLKVACVQPNEAPSVTATAWGLILECCAAERLTDDEIIRGYRATLRKSPCYRPKYGDWLEACRPSVTEQAKAATHRAECETIFALILENPGQVYGQYSPECGFVYERRLIENAHGRAAGEAFAAIQGRMRNLATVEDEKWARIEFCRAYEALREDRGAPLSLTPPSRRLTESKPTLALSGSTAEQDAATAARTRLHDLIHGTTAPTMPRPVDVRSRLTELRNQAAELSAST